MNIIYTESTHYNANLAVSLPHRIVNEMKSFTAGQCFLLIVRKMSIYNKNRVISLHLLMFCRNGEYANQRYSQKKTSMK